MLGFEGWSAACSSLREGSAALARHNTWMLVGGRAIYMLGWVGGRRFLFTTLLVVDKRGNLYEERAPKDKQIISCGLRIKYERAPIGINEERA